MRAGSVMGLEGRWRLYVEETPWAFGGSRVWRSDARYYVLGVPLDSTASYRSGQRWGPWEIRKASAMIEFNSLRTGLDVDEVAVVDVGDVAVVPGDIRATLERVEEAVTALAGPGRTVVILGGEHTATLAAVSGVARAHGEPPCIVSFDAHFDLRDSLAGARLSHATFMRRLLERLRVPRLVYVGVRGFAREEVELARRTDVIEYFTPRDVASLGEVNVAARIARLLSSCRSIYVTVDMDVLDPAYAPGVGNPEPEGLTTFTLYEILTGIVDERLAGLDVVEVAPPHDCGGITSITAAKTVVEAVAAVEAARRRGASS